MAETKFITIDILKSHDQWLYDYISKEDAKAIKAVAIKGNELLFYKEEKPGEDTVPAFRIELPSQDVSTLIQKVANATAGHLPSLTADGSIKDSGILADNVAIKADVTKEIAAAIANAGHMAKEVVTKVPEAASAKANTFYLLKKDNATGADKYEIWTLIGEEMVLIDDTSVDLTGYITSDAANAAISKAKTDAISTAAEDATSKASQALTDAKAYTDGKVSPVSDKVNTVEGKVTTLEGTVTTQGNTLTAQGDKIKALEDKVGDMQVATTEEALEAFNSVFNPTTTG